ncbi:MAG: hypothetical protein ACREJM_05765 [Candidatus Saccharimonadales bacterium]
MVCVYCGGSTEVINSRRQKKNNSVWRRRRCTECRAVFSTQETAQYALAWQVRHGGRLEPFSKLRLLMSLHTSCGHRKSALGDAEALTETVVRKLSAYLKNGSIDKEDITQVVQVALNRFDKAASVHYAAHHRRS